ncbi:MAG TPA: AAA family ATPase [Agitococcus sp.]|nr:AAA family ATPase [Agitococcus sp.]
MIVLIGGEKGGTGKTTLATNLIVERANEIGDVLLVDADRQMTASHWCSVRENNNISPRISNIQKYGQTLKTETRALSNKYQDIIIDTGGRDAPELRAGLLVSDIFVIPLRPSQFDLWTLSKIQTLVEEVIYLNEKLKAFVLLNQSSTNPSVKELQDAKELLKEFEFLNLMNAALCERIAFRKAAIRGESVAECNHYDSKAIAEIKLAYNEIYHPNEVINESSKVQQSTRNT